MLCAGRNGVELKVVSRCMWLRKSVGSCTLLQGGQIIVTNKLSPKCCGHSADMGFVNVSPTSQQNIKVTDTNNNLESYYILSLLSYYTKQDCHTSLLAVTQSNIVPIQNMLWSLHLYGILPPLSKTSKSQTLTTT
jgi:hypothetical protein